MHAIVVQISNFVALFLFSSFFLFCFIFTFLSVLNLRELWCTLGVHSSTYTHSLTRIHFVSKWCCYFAFLYSFTTGPFQSRFWNSQSFLLLLLLYRFISFHFFTSNLCAICYSDFCLLSLSVSVCLSMSFHFLFAIYPERSNRRRRRKW